jgi:hypothetical protein
VWAQDAVGCQCWQSADILPLIAPLSNGRDNRDGFDPQVQRSPDYAKVDNASDEDLRPAPSAAGFAILQRPGRIVAARTNPCRVAYHTHTRQLVFSRQRTTNNKPACG